MTTNEHPEDLSAWDVLQLAVYRLIQNTITTDPPLTFRDTDFTMVAVLESDMLDLADAMSAFQRSMGDVA